MTRITNSLITEIMSRINSFLLHNKVRIIRILESLAWGRILNLLVVKRYDQIMMLWMRLNIIVVLLTSSISSNIMKKDTMHRNSLSLIQLRDRNLLWLDKCIPFNRSNNSCINIRIIIITNNKTRILLTLILVVQGTIDIPTTKTLMITFESCMEIKLRNPVRIKPANSLQILLLVERARDLDRDHQALST